ncbi:MAG: hypothetical protein E7168_00100 [Firmicutes bacterium]|nr:hypothetical protein [Bacillota bacterium]
MNISELINELKVKEALLEDRKVNSKIQFNKFIKSKDSIIADDKNQEKDDFNIFIKKKEDYSCLEIIILAEKIEKNRLLSSTQILQECMKYKDLNQVEELLRSHVQKYDFMLSCYQLLEDLMNLTKEEYPEMPFEDMESCKMIQNNWKLIDKYRNNPDRIEKISEEMIAYKNSLTKEQLGNLTVQEYTINYKHNQGLYFAPLQILGNNYFRNPNEYITLYFQSQMKVIDHEELLSLEHYHKILSSIYHSDYFKEKQETKKKNF